MGLSLTPITHVSASPLFDPGRSALRPLCPWAKALGPVAQGHRAFPRFLPCKFILLSTTIPISGLNNAACFLVPPSFVLPLPGWHVGFPTDLLARL